jgi:hypothetical protein
MHRKFLTLVVLCLAVLLALPGLAFAQSTSVVWNRWDDQITVQSNNQMQIAETQEVAVSSGSVRQGTRYWTQPVQLQQVYVIQGSDQTPQALTANSSGQPGTYTFSNDSNGNPSLTYILPTTVNAGSSFIVQINYSATSQTTGMVDWRVIPSDHGADIRSSTITINFPSGQAPDPSLVRVTNGNASASVNGNTVVIKSQGTIPAQQELSIQVPFGAGVGAANNSNTGNTGVTGSTSGNSVNNVPASTDTSSPISLPSGSTLLLLICGGGLILLLGGGTLLRGLLGGVLGGGGSGGIFGGSNNIGSQGPFNGGSSGGSSFQGPSVGGARGFRQSANQNRQIGSVGNDKESGGGASFK